MRTFKEYLEEARTTLSWDSGNAENRPSILSWDSGHSESRSDEVNEVVTAKTTIDGWAREKDSVQGGRRNAKGALYDADIHDHPDVKPKRFTHAKSVENFVSAESQSSDGHGSSKNINGYLRNKMGDKTSKVVHHTPEAVHEAVKKLSSNFTPANTNRKEITTYSGIPHHIGQKLEDSKSGDVHHLAGFTSTSTSRSVAADFSQASADKDKPHIRHIIKFTVKPGAGLSTATKSGFTENEITLHHGAKTVYSHTEVNHGTHYIGTRAKPLETHIHHVTVHPEHLSLESYGSYDHPK